VSGSNIEANLEDLRRLLRQYQGPIATTLKDLSQKLEPLTSLDHATMFGPSQAGQWAGSVSRAASAELKSLQADFDRVVTELLSTVATAEARMRRNEEVTVAEYALAARALADRTPSPGARTVPVAPVVEAVPVAGEGS